MQQAKHKREIDSIMSPKAIEQGSSRLHKVSTYQPEANNRQLHSPISKLDLPPSSGPGAPQQAMNLAEPALSPSLPAVGQTIGSANQVRAPQESGIAPSKKVGCDCVLCTVTQT